MRMQVPITKPQPWVLPVTVVCLALGILIALMLKLSTPDTTTPDPNMRPEEQARYYKLQNDELQKEINKVRTKLNDYIDASTNQDKLQKALLQELDDLRIRDGETIVEGPGIVITADDTNMLKPSMTNTDSNALNALLIHDIDLMMVVNELRAAGAEAIAINDQRVVGSTAIRCVGPVIRINDRTVSTPFIIQAIGKADTLYGGMNLPDGELDYLRKVGFHVDVVKKDKMRVPAIVVLPPLEVGKVVVDKKNAGSSGQ